MRPVVLDSDVASLAFRGRLTAALETELAGRTPCASFVTLAELTVWAEARQWGPRNRAALGDWLGRLTRLPYDDEVARTWGRLQAAAMRRGRTRPVNDTWIAACCLVEDLPLATRNLKDFTDFVDHHGLRLIVG